MIMERAAENADKRIDLLSPMAASLLRLKHLALPWLRCKNQELRAAPFGAK
jgi:hypothetical protein